MRIAIVNDLALAREVLRKVVLSVHGNVVAWMADDGDTAVAKATADRPDVILMDLIMPRLSGVEATRQIMKQSPCPILVVTASVATNYAQACQAMGAGALDAVDTPTLGTSGTLQNAEKLVARLVKLEAEIAAAPRSGSLVMPLPRHAPVSVGTRDLSPAKPGAPDRAVAAPIDLPPMVLLGASTGGPEALAQVLSTLPADFPAAVLIAQHIGADFAPGLVQQLASRVKLPVRAAKHGDTPMAGLIHVAVSNDHLTIGVDGLLRYTPEPRTLPFRPSIDVLFTSAVQHSRAGVAVLLTGMGTDGANGLLQLRAAGWHTIAQDEATSTVYGMPKAALEKNAAVEVLPLQHIGGAILVKILARKHR